MYFERLGWFFTLKLTLKIRFWQLFFGHSTSLISKSKSLQIIVMNVIGTSIWNVCIKFRWHGEKLTYVSCWLKWAFCTAIVFSRRFRVPMTWKLNSDLKTSEFLFLEFFLCICRRPDSETATGDSVEWLGRMNQE